jgi:type II secretory pathway pseudopilin PulG
VCGSSSCESGFSLVESVVACALLTVGVLSLAQLFAMAVSMNISSRHATLAIVLASQKLEELRTTAEPMPGVEFLDARGGAISPADDAQPPDSAFIRRWTIDPLPVDPLSSAVVHVIVTPVGAGVRDVSLVSVRWRGSPW